MRPGPIRLGAFQVCVEEFEDGFVASDLIFRFTEAVAFVVEDDVFNGDIVGAQCLDHFVGFDLEYANIVGTLQDDHGPDDLISVEERGNLVQVGLLCGGVAEFFV